MIVLSSVRTWGRLAVFGLLCTACTAAPPDSGTPSAVKGEPKSAVASPAEHDTGLPAAEKLLADAVEAMGGAAKFASLTSYYEESQVSMGKLGLTGAAKGWWRGGDFYNEMEMPGVGLMRTGSLAGKPWGDDPINGTRALTGKEAEQAAWNMSLCPAHDWKRYFKTAETTAVKEVEGQQIAEITLTSALGDKVVLGVDLASKLPALLRFTQASPLGDTPATVYFKDFRKVDGFNLPFQQVLDAKLTTVVSTRSRLELNAPTDESRFAMPAAASTTITPGALVDGAKIDAEQVAAAKAAAAEKAAKAEAKAEKRKPGKG